MILLPWIALILQYVALAMPVALCAYAFTQWNGLSKWLCMVVGLVMLAVCGVETISLFQGGNLTGLFTTLIDTPLFLLLLVARTLSDRPSDRKLIDEKRTA